MSALIDKLLTACSGTRARRVYGMSLQERARSAPDRDELGAIVVAAHREGKLTTAFEAAVAARLEEISRGK